jgi:diacylglycerol O-acyltransferase / wax synthase
MHRRCDICVTEASADLRNIPSRRDQATGMSVAQGMEGWRGFDDFSLALDGLGLLAPALARLPGSLISQLAGGLTKANDLQASNVPGIRDEVYLAGARIERMYGFGPLPGCAAMITLMTHGSTCCVGVNVDPAAVTDPERFGRCLETGFAEVLALHDDAAAPVRRAS